MKLKRIIPMVLMMILLVMPVLAQSSTPEAIEAPAPAKITINVSGIQPEGVEYDAAHQRFLIGSLTDGKIRQVADDGTTSVFIDDPMLHASVGLQIDAKRNRLLVADATGNDAFLKVSIPGRAGLGAYDLDTGKQLFYVDLGSLTKDPRHFANDVALDADGNAYVTDSLAPVIYKVDLQGHATVFARDDRFTDPSEGLSTIGLDGIDYDPAGYLLVSQANDEKMFKVPLSDPTNVTEVKLPELFGGDGMEFGADGNLYVVAYFDSDPQAILALNSSNDWATATVTAQVETDSNPNATTLALRDGVPYYIDSFLSSPHRDRYTIVRADLKPVASSTASS